MESMCKNNAITASSAVAAALSNHASTTYILSSPSSPTCIGRSPPSSPPPPSTTPPVILTPCAACKILRRRCVEKCILAPYFPPTDPMKFTIAHRVFGASNITKFLQDLPHDQRADAVNSMVYEAKARLKDPVYGCAGAISLLQNQINELQAELAKTQAQMLNIQCQNTNFLDFICNSTDQSSQDHHEKHPDQTLPRMPSNIIINTTDDLLFEEYVMINGAAAISLSTYGQDFCYQ